MPVYFVIVIKHLVAQVFLPVDFCHCYKAFDSTGIPACGFVIVIKHLVAQAFMPMAFTPF